MAQPSYKYIMRSYWWGLLLSPHSASTISCAWETVGTKLCLTWVLCSILRFYLSHLGMPPSHLGMPPSFVPSGLILQNHPFMTSNWKWNRRIWGGGGEEVIRLTIVMNELGSCVCISICPSVANQQNEILLLNGCRLIKRGESYSTFSFHCKQSPPYFFLSCWQIWPLQKFQAAQVLFSF